MKTKQPPLHVLVLTLLFAGLSSTVSAALLFEPQQQPYGTIAPVAVSSPILLSGNEALYQPWFETSAFGGDLKAWSLDSSGRITSGAPVWQAGVELNTNAALNAAYWDTGRIIITTDGAGNGIPFRFNSLTATQQALVQSADVVNYVRGWRPAVADDAESGCRDKRDHGDDDGDDDGSADEHSSSIDRGDGPHAGSLVRVSMTSLSSEDDGDDDGGDDDEGHGHDKDKCHGDGSDSGFPDRSLMGTIVHSRPVFVGQPREGYPFGNYGSAFAAPLKERDTLVYVGANDAMMHVIQADTGVELFAFVPSDVLGNLPDYALYQPPTDDSPDQGCCDRDDGHHSDDDGNDDKHDFDSSSDRPRYSGNDVRAGFLVRASMTAMSSEDDGDDDEDHDKDKDKDKHHDDPAPVSLSHIYFVDGQLTTGDVFFDDSWHTVLVGGLGAGGQEFFALDITNPATRVGNEASAANMVLWEFTDNNDSDLGFTYSRPSIVRLNDADNTWAAVAGNGYVNSYDDGQIGNGQAALYILNIKTGQIIRKISVGSPGTTEPNGLSSPTLVDINGDYTADFAYAGDLKGNVWKFDLTADSSGNWSAALDNNPLFSARDSDGNMQPITTAPAVAHHPLGGLLVMVGTGRLLDNVDINDTSIQSFYGLRDNNDSAISGRAKLQPQTLREQTAGSQTVRTASDNNVDWDAYRGWRIDLPAGEKVVTDPIARAGRVQFTSNDPASDENWLNELNIVSGGSPSQGAIDVTGNGVVNDSDDADSKVVVSVYQGQGLVSRPTFAAVSDDADVYFVNRLDTVSQQCQNDYDSRKRKNHHDNDDGGRHDDDDKDHDEDDDRAGDDCTPKPSDRHRRDDDDDNEDDHDKDKDDDHRGGGHGDDDASDGGDDGGAIDTGQVNRGLQRGENLTGRTLWREILF
jgi:Tfp pilus tip-associated adhesin PilY1